MRWFLAGIAFTLLSGIIIGLFVYFIVLPRWNWGADQEPPKLEEELVGPVIDRWIDRNASNATNPVAATPENLKDGREEYEEHCAPCHGRDGSGHNAFGASFYPPVPKLTGDTQQLSDGQLFFIISKGFASTGMPSFGKRHDTEDIWRMVLWTRHLGQLTPEEKDEMEKKEDGHGGPSH